MYFKIFLNLFFFLNLYTLIFSCLWAWVHISMSLFTYQYGDCVDRVTWPESTKPKSLFSLFFFFPPPSSSSPLHKHITTNIYNYYWWYPESYLPLNAQHLFLRAACPHRAALIPLCGSGDQKQQLAAQVLHREVSVFLWGLWFLSRLLDFMLASGEHTCTRENKHSKINISTWMFFKYLKGSFMCPNLFLCEKNKLRPVDRLLESCREHTSQWLLQPLANAIEYLLQTVSRGTGRQPGTAPLHAPEFCTHNLLGVSGAVTDLEGLDAFGASNSISGAQ